MISSVRPPTALVPGPTSKPDRFVSLDATVNAVPRIFRHACVFGQTVEHALAVCDHSDRRVLLRPLVKQKSFSNRKLAQHCSRVFCQVKSISTCTSLGPKSRQDGSF